MKAFNWTLGLLLTISAGIGHTQESRSLVSRAQTQVVNKSALAKEVAASEKRLLAFKQAVEKATPAAKSGGQRFDYRRLGGGSDGGSCGEYRGGSSFELKDFTRAGRTASPEGSGQNSLGVGPVGKVLGLEIFDGTNKSTNFRHLTVYKTALANLEAWKTDSPELAGMIASALQQIQFAGVHQYLKPLAYGCTGASEFPAIVYVNNQAMALISLPVWNAFSTDAKIGALYKEALRFLQSENQMQLFNGEGLTEKTEKVLSDIVATLVLDQPRANGNTLAKIFVQAGYQPQVISAKVDFEALLTQGVEMQRAALVAYNKTQDPRYYSQFSEITDYIEILGAYRLRKIFQSPEVRGALVKLNAITRSLNSGRGEGPIALKIMADEIEKSQQTGRPLPADIQESVQQFRSKIQEFVHTPQ